MTLKLLYKLSFKLSRYRLGEMKNKKRIEYKSAINAQMHYINLINSYNAKRK